MKLMRSEKRHIRRSFKRHNHIGLYGYHDHTDSTADDDDASGHCAVILIVLVIIIGIMCII